MFSTFDILLVYNKTIRIKYFIVYFYNIFDKISQMQILEVSRKN